MDIVKFSIEKPAASIVATILIVLFGIIGLMKMPYQLSPSVVSPEITVQTVWEGATPYEIERDIIEEQEKVLKGIPGLKELESTSSNGMGSITLTFSVGTNIDDALLRVSNKLNEVRQYPTNADKPVINATGAATSPVIWMILKSLDGNDKPVGTYKTYFENEVKQYLERVEGVADLFMRGGIDDEMHIYVIPEKLAAYGLTISNVTEALQRENVNVSAGTLGVERRNFRIRTVAEFKSPKEIEEVVLKSDGMRQVKIKDIATVSFGYKKRTDAMFHNHKEGIAVGVKPVPGANVLELTDNVHKVVEMLNAEKLKPRGIQLEWVYDQRKYIRGAIDLVKDDIIIGGILAVIVLMVFLRSLSSVTVVAIAIPISIIGTFIVMHWADRTLNVVSLAGLSLAIGTFIDNAIVVLENIDRHSRMGKPSAIAAYDGAKEVTGAIVASTLTNIAVFLPVVFVQEEAGQLFRDIAIAITTATCVSLFASLSVIPMLASFFYKSTGTKTSILDKIGTFFIDLFMAIARTASAKWWSRIFTVIILVSLSMGITMALFPKMEYLPQGNRNLVINILIPPPGLSLKEREAIGDHIFNFTKPHFRKDSEGIPGIRQLFYIGAEELMLFGAMSTDEQRAGALIPLFMKTIG
ncbi:MAG: efflux RND transporter permease subunit, partial [Candidatus Magnetoovum sp. WYHC-5]|nr:efflux RND transporter permease subunit [Candidatus Magnetoovum sp. WYHC-5]